MANTVWAVYTKSYKTQRGGYPDVQGYHIKTPSVINAIRKALRLARVRDKRFRVTVTSVDRCCDLDG